MLNPTPASPNPTIAVLRPLVPSSRKPTVSVVIPSFNHRKDLLEPCLESIRRHTDLGHVEVIVVANGCTDGTEGHVLSLGEPFRCLSYTSPLGYTKAVNEGLKVARGDYVVLLNNDTVLAEQPKDSWLDLMLRPFLEDPRTGITGPVKAWWDCGGVKRSFMAFWCAMVPRKLFTEIGFLDEIFSPGMGEDADFSIRVEEAGYRLVRVPNDGSEEFGKGISDQSFPISHKGSGTFGDKDYSDVAKRNQKILLDRYGKNGMKISIVIPTANHLSKYLKPCLESVVKFTDLSKVEVIVVANGCTDGTEDYVRSLGEPFRVLSYPERVGQAKALNEGILEAHSDSEHIILLDDDTAILQQDRHRWVDVLLEPFRKDPKTGMSGIAKYLWNCRGIKFQVMQLWCAALSRKMLSETGLLDETFHPGPGTDWDLSIRAKLHGYGVVQVPVDEPRFWGHGIANPVFPIFHVGSGTYGDKDQGLISKNVSVMAERYGPKDRLEEIYNICLVHECDVNRLFPTFRKYAEQCRHITEFGVRGVFSTYAFLAARPRSMVSYDVVESVNIQEAKDESKKAGIHFEFVKADVLDVTIKPTELLFIDTKHTYAHLKAELERHSRNVSKWILVHDTESFGLRGEDGGPGELQAIDEFLKAYPEWREKERTKESNGLVVLERAHDKSVSISIVIPTCGKLWESVLKKCLEAVIDVTDLAEKEIIVVANGAPKEAIQYLSERHDLRVLQFPERIGYIRAVNAGIEVARGKYVITLDDDSILQPQGKDHWINLMAEPFLKDRDMAATGPFGQVYPDLGEILHSGCTMYKMAALRKVGTFDEIFNPGYLSDEDLAIRLRKAGYHLCTVPVGQGSKYVNGTFVIQFPIVHMGNVNTMDKNGADLPLVARNRKILLERHADLVNANLQGAGSSGTPGVEYRELPLHDGPGSPTKTDPVTGGRGHLGRSGYTPPAARPKISIIIPTYKNNFRTDETTGEKEKINLLRRNLESLAFWTDLVERNVEVLVVCNGCVDGQADYVNSLGAPFRAISFPDALGYTKATNEGIKAATGEYLIFLNDDVEMLPQPKNCWLDWLVDPFLENPKMGVTGPLQLHDDYADQDVIIGFCLCVSRKVLNDAMAGTNGVLDEIYSPGGGEDIDLCCKVRAKGYIVKQVPKEGKLGFSHTNTGDFQIWHVNNQTFKDIPEYTRWYVKRNGWINAKRYNKSLRLNLGSGGVFYKGFLSVDLHDQRADVIADATKLDLDDGCVQEILAIHLFEHLSPYKADDALREWFRVLRPGGKLVMEMPDIEDLCKRFLSTQDFGDRWGVLNAMYAPVNTTGEGAATEITSPHLYGYWSADLVNRLVQTGFTDVQLGPEQFPHPYPPNLHIEATKPVRNSKPDADSDIGKIVAEADKIQGWMDPGELEWLAVQARGRRTIIEVGSWKGRSTKALAATTPGTVYAVDHWLGSKSERGDIHAEASGGGDVVFKAFQENLSGEIASGKVVVVRMDSKDAAKELSRRGIIPDMVFIDAEHSYEATRREIETWRPMLLKGGLLSGHDYQPEWAGVVRAVDELVPGRKVVLGNKIWSSVLPPRAMKPMKDLWSPPPDRQVPFGDDTTYKMAMNFLSGCDKIEDWGCGTAYARRFMKEGVYVGIDGSRHSHVDVHAELAEYRSQTEGLLLRHVLDHNVDWKMILENAMASFTKKMVVVISTPFGEETKPIAKNWSEIPDMQFRKEDLTDYWKGLSVTEEVVKTSSQYGQETVFYIQKA